MLKIIKILFYFALAGLALFLYWFMPKYSYVQKNPGFCANLTEHLYYCGSGADLNSTFNKASNANIQKTLTVPDENLNQNMNSNDSSN